MLRLRNNMEMPQVPNPYTDSSSIGRVRSNAQTCAFIESVLGFSPHSFPLEGIEIRDTPKRTEKAGERLMIRRIGNAALATGIPRVMNAIGPLIESISLWELFSPFGMGELRRLLPLDIAENLAEIYHYTLISRSEFCPQSEGHSVIQLFPADYRPGSEEVDAFAAYEGGVRASVVSVRSPLPGYIFINVETRRDYQGKGYGAAVVSAAADWILRQDSVAHYNVRTPNAASIRIARRLGFLLTSQVLIA